MNTDPNSTIAPTQIYSDGSYFEKHSSWHVEDSPWKAEQIAKIMARNAISANTVCEIGCGAGEILKQLEVKMPQTVFTGYELSPQAFEMCVPRTSARVAYKNTDVFKEDVHFDAMLCIDVFEHVDDYYGFLRNLKGKATYKIFHIPLDVNVQTVVRDWQVQRFKNLGHVHFFTEATALLALQYAGYEIVDSAYTKWFSDKPPKSRLELMARLPRKLLYAISPKWMVKLVGGCSLIVLAK